MLSATNQGSLYLQGGGRMKPYRGTLLATAMLIAALPLSGCGDEDTWKKTNAVTLETSTPSVQVEDKAIFTVKSAPPAEGEGYACNTDIEYRAQGAGLNVNWANVPGTDTTRVFELRPRQTNSAGLTLSVVARARCLESREDWKYSDQVNVTVTQKILPVVTAVTLTLNSLPSVNANDDVVYTISATTEIGCTLNLRRSYSGGGFPGAITQVASPGTQPVLNPPGTTGAISTLTLVATGWCAENPVAVVSSDTVFVTVAAAP